MSLILDSYKVILLSTDNDDDVDSQKIKENDLNAAKIKEFEKIKNEFGYDTTKNIDFLKISIF